MSTNQSAIRPRHRLGLQFGLLALALAAVSASASTPVPTLSAIAGTNQSTPYGSVFSKNFTVKVTNPSTRLGMPGIQVNFTAAPGIQLLATSAVTDSNGYTGVAGLGTVVGTSSVTAQLASNPTVTFTFTNATVVKAQLTVVPGNVQSITGLIPNFQSYTLQGFVNGETAATANVTGAPGFTTTAYITAPAGNYAIRTTAGTLSAQNYTFVSGLGWLTLTGLQPCGILGLATNGKLKGTYAFNLFNQQGGYSGILTADGISKVHGQTFLNMASDPYPSQWNFVGNYGVGIGYRGTVTLLQTSAVNSTITHVISACFAVDNVVNGIVASGRLIESDGYNSSTAGTFYLLDGSATTNASFNGTYIAGLQGTRLDPNTGAPLQYAEVAALHLDGNGNVSGGLYDVDFLQSNGGIAAEQYTGKQQITGTYSYDPTQNSGVITVTDGTTVTNLFFLAPTSQHLLLVTQDPGTSPTGVGTAPVFFGEALKQTAGPFSAATFSGNANLLTQGIDTSSNNGNLIVQASGISFDGVGTMSNHGLVTVVDGSAATAQASSTTYPYTVDPATGRFESLNPGTGSCYLCGYLVGPTTLVALSPGSGMPLFTTLQTATTAPAALKLSSLNGKYSGGTMALISPLVTPFEGIITFDGKGNFSGAADIHSNTAGQINNMKFAGTYAVANGAFALTLTGDSTPDFYLYLNTKDTATLIPYSPAETSTVPLLTINAVIP